MCNRGKKAKKSAVTASKMATAPWIYINDNSLTGYVTEELSNMIPKTFLITAFRSQGRLEFRDSLSSSPGCVCIVRDTRPDKDHEGKREAIQLLKQTALEAGANCVSVNVMNEDSEVLVGDKLSESNHYDIIAGVSAAKAIYKWLFTVLTIRETLHLISDADMQKIDRTLFPQYEYCSIAEARLKPKNAKIQFVALILTKPQVSAGNKLTWTVVDKSGSANFYFQHRGENSQYTWDWVLNLKPGDRRALPRMPMVQIKERVPVRVIKAPFRAVGSVIGAAGFVLKQTGHGISKVGKSIKMGQSGEWVPEADVDAKGKKIDWTKPKAKTVKKEEVAKDLDEKSEKVWDDDASDASTEAGTETSEDKMKDFL